MWIRLQIADADPGAMLVTLLGAAARLDADTSQRMAETAAGHARLGEWRAAFQSLAGWLAAAAGPSAVLVLEGAEHLEAGSPTSLDLLVSAFLPNLAGSLNVMLVGFTDWDSRRLDPHGHVLGRRGLRLDRRSAALLAEALLPGLSAPMLDRCLALTCGGAGALQAAFSAGAALGPEVFCAVTAQAGNGQQLYLPSRSKPT